MADLSRKHMLAVHKLLREEQDRVRLSGLWRNLHQTFELGEPRAGYLYFTPEQRRQLRDQARLLWGFDPLGGVPGGNRREAAANAIDEKIAPERPDAGHVLLKGRLPQPLPVLAPELSLRAPLASLHQDGITQVVVVENLDSFDDWHAFAIPGELADALVLYRGHDGLARGARRLLAALPAEIPITVFPDWDPAGLRIALTLPRAEALLVPELTEDLIAKGSRDHFARQHQASVHLDRADLLGWRDVWLAMKAQGVSIKQQHMLALGSRLKSIPHRGHGPQGRSLHPSPVREEDGSERAPSARLSKTRM